MAMVMVTRGVRDDGDGDGVCTGGELGYLSDSLFIISFHQISARKGREEIFIT